MVNASIFLFLVTMVWAYAVLHFGGVVAEDRRVYLLAMGAVGLVWWLVNRRRAAEVPRVLRWSACLLPAYVAFQVIPLPGRVLAMLSPGRLEILRGLEVLAPQERTATLSVAPGTTMNHLLLICGYALVFFLMYQIAAEFGDRRWMAMAPVVGVAVLEAVLGIVQALGGQVASGTYVNRDHYAGLLEMALPFSLAYPVAVWRRLDTRREFPLRPALMMMVCFGAAVAILIGILSSLSRTGFIAPLFSVLVMGIVAWRGNRWRSAGLVALLAGGLLGSFVFLPSDQLIERFAHSPDELSAEGRLMLWRESLQVVRAFPVFGCGLGAYEPAFLRYKVSAPMVSDDHAHNDYLQFLIELGVVGFAIGAVLFTGVLARAWRATTRASEPANRFLAIASIGALAAIGLHSVVDFNLAIPGNAMLLAWICGVASTLTPVVESVSDSDAEVTIEVPPKGQGLLRRSLTGRGQRQ
jgi:O-antigen ligase